MRWLADRYWDAWATVAGTVDGGRDVPGAREPDRAHRLPVRLGGAARGLGAGAARAGEASDHLPVVAELEVED